MKILIQIMHINCAVHLSRQETQNYYNFFTTAISDSSHHLISYRTFIQDTDDSVPQTHQGNEVENKYGICQHTSWHVPV